MAQRSNTLLAFLAVGGYALWKNRDQVGAFAQKVAGKAGAAANSATQSASATPGSAAPASTI